MRTLTLAIAWITSCYANGSEPAPSAPAAPPAAAAPVPPAEPAAPPATPPAVPPLSPSARTEDEQNTIGVFRAVAPATVFVTQTQVVVDRWRMRALEVPSGSGTGILWDDRGDVVTNYHVVDGGRSYKVTLYDQTEWPAVLVGGDPRKDVAVLHIDAPKDKLVPARLLDDGATVDVGQKTVAIGNPFGLDHTLTTGVVSAVGREVMGYGGVSIRGMIQTDASINPGNSGGPLLDSQGRLIGMNTMITSESGSSAGIGFAVPVATIRRVVDQILTNGKVERLGLGASFVEDAVARQVGIDGLVILDVASGSPAAKAGLRGLQPTNRGPAVGDVIVAIDGAPIHGYEDLYYAFDDHHAGDSVKVTLLRNNQRVDVQATLADVNE